MFTRREFIGTSLATSVAAGALPLLADAAEPAAKGDTCPGGLAQPLLHECGVEGALRAPAGALYQDRRQGRPVAPERHHGISRGGKAQRVFAVRRAGAAAESGRPWSRKQLLTQTVALGLDATLPLEELKPLFRAVNDELAEVVRAHPTRFLGVAALPTADPHWAADELRRAHRELGFIGGSLPLNAFATHEGALTLAPLFAEAQKHGSHFFIHRGPASSSVPASRRWWCPRTRIRHAGA